MRPVARDMNNFWTPQYIFEYGEMLAGEKFQLDVAADQENTKCENYYTKEDNALFNKWQGVNWCNPPYSNIEMFVDKAIFEAQDGNMTVMLLPVRTSNKYWKKILANASIVFIGGRIKFEGHNITKGGCSAESSAYCIFYYETLDIGMASHADVTWIHKKEIKEKVEEAKQWREE